MLRDDNTEVEIMENVDYGDTRSAFHDRRRSEDTVQKKSEMAIRRTGISTEELVDVDEIWRVTILRI